ncbi:MAG: Kelch repeat-containing protein [Parvularculaceae bacterium]
MSAFDRRSFLLGSGAALAIASAARAHPHKGRWVRLADMLGPAREFAAAPFYAEHARDPRSDIPEIYNIVVIAGGVAPNPLYNVTDNEPYNVINSVTYYNPRADRWEQAQRLPEARRKLSLATHNGLLYAAGGYGPSETTRWVTSDKCWRLRTISGDWEPIRPLPHPIAEAVCQAFDGRVHIVGGRAPFGSRNEIRRDQIETAQHWAYDWRDDTWIKRASMPTSRSGAASAVYKGFLHVIGGRSDGSGDLSTHEVYDPLADRWSSAADLPRKRSDLAAAAIGDSICVFGGAHVNDPHESFADVWLYDPRGDKWSAATRMCVPRSGAAAVSLKSDESIYVAGGAVDGEASQALFRFTLV